MAYQIADGFDNYGNSYSMTSGYPWDGASGSTTSTADYAFAPPASLPGGCVNIAGNGNNLSKTLSGPQGTLIVGYSFKPSGLPGSASGNIMELNNFHDGATEQVCLTLNNNGALQFYRGNSSGTPIGTITPNATITANAWYSVAMQITFATGTGGSVVLYLNGNSVPIINSAGINTSASGANQATQCGIGMIVNAPPSTKYDDFYCFDTTGAFQNSLPSGTGRILTKMPASAGTYTNWTPTGLSSNYQNAAVQPPSTSDYNANNTGGTKDSYTMQVAGLAVAPYFVIVRASMERDDAGTHTPSLFMRSGAVDGSGVATPALTSSYLFYDAVFQTDPATSSAWTGAGVDAAQVGVIEG